MNQTNVDRSPAEVAEIEKHKYFLSEQMGYDVGWETAEQDWESNHAETFRQSSAHEQSSPHETSGERAGGVGTLLKRVFTKKKR